MFSLQRNVGQTSLKWHPFVVVSEVGSRLWTLFVMAVACVTWEDKLLGFLSLLVTLCKRERERERERGRKRERLVWSNCGCRVRSAIPCNALGNIPNTGVLPFSVVGKRM